MQPEPLETLLEGLLAKLGLPAPSVSLSLDEGWNEITGQARAGGGVNSGRRYPRR